MKKVDPFLCSPATVVQYLRMLYEKGSAYRTVNFHRSAISKLHAGFGNLPAGEHPLVAQAVKAVFRLRPPLPRYKSTFDVELVLNHVKNLPENSALSLKQLSQKTLFLTSFSTFSRVSSLSRLEPDVEFYQDFAVLHLQAVEKQSRPCNTRGYVSVLSLPEDPALCPVQALSSYLSKVSVLHEPLGSAAQAGAASPGAAAHINVNKYLLFVLQISNCRGDEKSLFVSFSPPFKSVTAKTLARWMCSFMEDSGVDTERWKQHSSRSASAAYRRRDLSLSQILALADWSAAGRTFKVFYERCVLRD